MNRNIKKIKTYFTIYVLLLLIIMISGSLTIKNHTIIYNYLLNDFKFYVYRVNLAQAESNVNKNVKNLISSEQINYKSSNNAKSIPVLLYHGIVNDNDNKFEVSTENFKNQMFALKLAGWQTVNIEDFMAFINSEKDLPDKSFLLTFDDGRKDSYYNADPILRALNYNAVMFAITGYSMGSGSNYYLSKKELIQMVDSGRWKIQPHSFSGHGMININDKDDKGHFFSNKMWLSEENRLENDDEYKQRVYNDLSVAKNDIENSLNQKVFSFAYPFGDYGKDSINYSESREMLVNVVKSLYELAFYQAWGENTFNYPKGGTFMIKRIDILSSWNENNLLEILSNGSQKDLPYFDDFSSNKGWLIRWGQQSILNNNFIIGSKINSSGANSILDGTYLWKNYFFKTKINFIKGHSVSLLARYQNSTNYISCNFSDKYVFIEQNLNGKTKTLADINSKNKFFNTNNEIILGINVIGDKVQCLIDNKEILYSYNINSELMYGGIAISTWDPKLNNSEVIIKEVKVEKIK